MPPADLNTDISIYERFRFRLITGGIGPGEKIKAEELSAEYNCAASTMREVFFRLSCEGFLNFKEQKGFRVPAVDLESLIDLAAVRIMIEKQGISLSIQHGGLDWEAQLKASHHKLEHVESIIRIKGVSDENVKIWGTSEWEFHNALISACQSEELLKMHRNIHDRFRQQLMNWRSNRGFRDNNIVEHQAILDAVLARDEVLSGKLIAEHLNNAYLDVPS